MRFDIDDYPGDYAMHCATQEEAEIFCDYLHSVGRSWCSGTPYDSGTNWEEYGEDTLYFFNEGTFGSLEFGHRERENLTILEFREFDFASTAEPVITLSFDELLNGCS